MLQEKVHSTAYHVFQFTFFDRASCTSVLLPEVKSRALIYLHIFKFVYLAIVHANCLIFKEVFLTLNNYLHFKMASP